MIGILPSDPATACSTAMAENKDGPQVLQSPAVTHPIVPGHSHEDDVSLPASPAQYSEISSDSDMETSFDGESEVQADSRTERLTPGPEPDPVPRQLLEAMLRQLNRAAQEAPDAEMLDQEVEDYQVDLFCETVAILMRSLSQENQTIVRTRIDQIMFSMLYGGDEE